MDNWLQRCPNLDVLQQRTFGSHSPPLGVLKTDTEKWLALTRVTFYATLGARLNNNTRRGIHVV